ncbi:MAG: ribosome maturation factor RimP [Chloracidobacterium sp.]|nr:ribosome maturation factor RimP [Chloracidobacterium sp.]
MDKQAIATRVRSIAQKAAAEANTELVQVEAAGTNRDLVLRIYIDKEKGVTLDDCAAFSQAVEAVLDAEDVIPVRYVLEVSSPGIERELYTLRDFERFTGKLAKLKTKNEIDGQKAFVGTIAGVDGDVVSFDDRSRGLMSVNYEDIAKANLKIDLGKEFGGR